MKPDRYEVSTAGRQRLSGLIQPRGNASGLSLWGALLFGLPFLAMGVWLLLASLRAVHVDPSKVHAPMWVIGVAGVSFAGGGILLWMLGARQFASERRRARALRDYPNDPALHDYVWNRQGSHASEWARAAKALGTAVALSLFLSPFNYIVFFEKSPLLVKVLIGLFDLLALGAWWAAIRAIGCAFKFGHSEVVYTRFPYTAEAPIVLRWKPIRGVARVEKGKFTLRCVEQWTERRGTGKHRRTVVIQEEIWSATWSLEEPRNLQLGEAIELSFEIPPDAPVTCLNATRPIFWELEANVELRGLDFSAKYLVPIYAPKHLPVHYSREMGGAAF
jgi:hypothetical protein